MWPLLVLLIPLFGYMYVDSDHYLKYKLKKSDGWHAYFLVSVQGLHLLLSMINSLLQLAVLFYFGMFALFFGVGIIDSVVTLWSVLPRTFVGFIDIVLTSLTNAWLLQFWDFFIFIAGLLKQLMTPNKISIILLVSLSIYSVSKSISNASQQNDEEVIEKVRQRIAQDSQVDAMIFEAEEAGLLVMITLKSRKVYVGQILGKNIGYTDMKEISLIPILSGYRDKDTLSFNVEHDYSDYYSRENITESSSMPLSHFQQVIFYDQIESMSLFDSETYKKFQKTKKNDETFWKKILKKVS